MQKFQDVYDKDKSNNNKEIYYYKEVVPMIKGYNIEIPDNKMNWVFCELSKFKKQHKNHLVDGNYTVKEQWLDFLINANEKKDLAENLNATVKRGYEIMKSVLQDEDMKILYWKEKRDKELYESCKLKELESLEKEAFDKGKWKGEIKGEISKFKDFLDLGVPKEKYQNKFTYIKPENFQYIEEHIDETESQIMGGMEIEYPDHI